MTFRISAPAKINLSLHITGKRDDGYHNLITRMQKLDLCDHLELDITDDGTVEIFCDSNDIPSDKTNLAVKAAVKFFDRCDNKTGKGLRIRLAKNIPVGAGLGGGSSDAAAVLKGLNSILNEPLSEQDLCDLGGELGADVPFFVSDHAAVIATGIGDSLAGVVSVDNYHYLLINPGFSVKTEWVYKNYRLTKEHKNFKLCGSQNSGSDSFVANELHNDLEQVTLPRHPVLGQIKETLLIEGADGTLMSGSGPTIFGLFSHRERAEIAQLRLEQIYNKKNFRIISAEAFTGA